MDNLLVARLQRFGAWCGLGYVVALTIGWMFVARFIPPHRPSDSAEQIVQIFQADTTRIRIGMLFVMLAALLMVPFTGAIARALAELEGAAGVLTYSAVLGGVGNMVLTFYPGIWWLVAAYRPDRGADLIYLLNDFSWLQFIGGVTMFLALPLSIGIAAFVDHRPEPTFPRWAGYFNIWISILILPDQLLFFFQTGPFAWNGVFGLWIPLVCFFGWFMVTIHLLRRGAARLATTATADRLEQASRASA